MLVVYNTRTQEQVQNKIMERVSNNQISNCKEFFLPRKPVIRKKAESTISRVLYDSSAICKTGVSLNDCLEK